MARDHSLRVHHVSHTVFAQVNAAYHIIEGVVFVYACQIQDGPFLPLYGYAHGDTQFILKNGGGVDSQIIGLLHKSE